MFCINDSYFHFFDRVRAMGIEIPIMPGIMPITNYSKLVRFSDACGAEIPRWIQKQLEAYGNNSESILKFGEELVSNLSRKLLEQGALGIHFYTMNQAEASLAIWNNIKEFLRENIE
jgi:methylenetetrahydrofolate reductase (NADPH)